MDDNRTHPMTDDDVTPPPGDTGFQPAAPLKDAGVAFRSDPAVEGQEIGKGDAGRQAKAGTEKLTQQATEKALMFAGQGKERATGALEQLSQVLTDAAQQVDEKLGSQYGQYARSAAGNVQGFADQLRAKDIDALVDDARAFVRKSPGVAIGAAAAIGFVLARLVSAGVDQHDA